MRTCRRCGYVDPKAVARGRRYDAKRDGVGSRTKQRAGYFRVRRRAKRDGISRLEAARVLLREARNALRRAEGEQAKAKARTRVKEQREELARAEAAAGAD